MKILITGANGMVARATIDYCNSLNDEVFAFTRQELDITDKAQVFDIFEREKPEAVINCAAFTDVDACESNAESAFSINALGVENLALASKKTGTVFVTISTDYIFDGAKEGFYTQRDDANPQGVYAKSKYEGEIRARNAYARSIIVRSGWIFGIHGTNFLAKLPELLLAEISLKAIVDSYGTPTYTPHLAKRLRELAELDLPAIYHVVNSGEGTSYAGFAHEIGINRHLIENVHANSLDRAAPRPNNSKMACLFSEKFGLAELPHWKVALAEYVANIKANSVKKVAKSKS